MTPCYPAIDHERTAGSIRRNRRMRKTQWSAQSPLDTHAPERRIRNILLHESCTETCMASASIGVTITPG